MEEKSTRDKLIKEFEDIQNSPNTSTGCTVGLLKDNNNDNDYFNWKISLVGPRESLYASGLFFLKISFPKNYPNSAPLVNFLTPIYHLNVRSISETNSKEPLGYIKDNTINFWKPSSTAKEILTKLYAIFYENNENNAYLEQRANEYRNNSYLFELKAKYYTNKYANVSNLNNGLNYTEKYWNFSINSYYLKVNNVLGKYFGKKPHNNNIYDDINTDKNIKLIFVINGIEEKDIECNMKDKTRDVIEKLFNKIGKKNDFDDALFIFGLRKLDLEKSIGQNGLNENLYITVISDYKCSEK